FLGQVIDQPLDVGRVETTRDNRECAFPAEDTGAGLNQVRHCHGVKARQSLVEQARLRGGAPSLLFWFRGTWRCRDWLRCESALARSFGYRSPRDRQLSSDCWLE